MSRYAHIFLSSSALCLMATAPALAAPPADTNNDGQISQTEFLSSASTNFTIADTNADNSLTRSEMEAWKKRSRDERADTRFDRLDVNGDGVISESEHDAKRHERADNMRKRFDLNKDGQVNRADRKQLQNKKSERQGHRAGPRERIKRDANQDGVITRAENDAAVMAMFERLDVNKDGVLTKGEGRGRRHKKRHRHFGR